MNKSKLLDVIAGLTNLAESLQSLAEEIANNEAVNAGQQEKPLPAPEPKSDEKKITLEQVRAVLADKSHAGFTAEVRALLEKHGAKKLSEINPENYAALLADAEELK